MIKVIIVVVILFSIFLYSISFDVEQHKKESEEIEKIMQNKKQEKIEVEKSKKLSMEELLLTRVIEMFTRVFEDDFKYVRNFVVTNSMTNRKTKVDLILLTKKSLFVVNAKFVRDGIVYLKTLDAAGDWKISRHDKNHNQIISDLKNPLKRLEIQIDALENLDLKYRFYYEPLVIFPRNIAVRKPYLDAASEDIIVENIVVAEQKLKKIKEEEDDLFTEQKIEYLHKYLMSKKFKEED